MLRSDINCRFWSYGALAISALPCCNIRPLPLIEHCPTVLNDTHDHNSYGWEAAWALGVEVWDVEVVFSHVPSVKG